jgi:uncharacterized protein (TIGR02466 family)
MNPAQRLQRAAAAFARGDLAVAEAECRGIVASRPQDADAVHLLGLVRRRAGDLAEAEALLRRAVAMAPQRAEVRVNLGNLLRARGALRDAEAEYRSALQREPHSRAARLALARVLNDGQAYAAAADEAGQLLREDERDAEAWVALGVARRAQGRLPEAESAYRQALALRPGYAVAQHNLGALLGQMNRAEESLERLDQAAALGVKGRELHFNRGRALIDLGRFDAADAALQSAVLLAPGDAETQVLLAKLRFMRGDPGFARDLAEAARSWPALRAVLADILRRAGRLEESADILRAIIETDGWSPGAAAGLAVNLQEQGRPADALAHARAAFGGQPDDSDMAETLISLLLQLGEGSDARTLIDRQRQRHPLDQRWLAHEATAARLLGDPKYEALFDYERFVRPFDLEPPAGYASIQEFNLALIARLGELHGQGFRTHPLDQSLRGGTQTSRSLLADPDPRIRTFLEALQAPLAAYQRAIGYDAAHPLLERNAGPTRIVGCWSVRLQRSGFHVNHVHPEGWISSAYYVEVPDEVQDAGAMSGWIKFGEPRFPTPGAGPAHFVQPRAGRLVLFPSYMWHGTTPIMGDQPRMTIAFDAVADRPPA